MTKFWVILILFITFKFRGEPLALLLLVLLISILPESAGDKTWRSKRGQVQRKRLKPQEKRKNWW